MRPSASHIDADQRRREIELAFAYLFGPALLAQRIALDTFRSTFEPAPVGNASQIPVTAPESADETAAAAPPVLHRIAPKLEPDPAGAVLGATSPIVPVPQPPDTHFSAGPGPARASSDTCSEAPAAELFVPESIEQSEVVQAHGSFGFRPPANARAAGAVQAEVSIVTALSTVPVTTTVALAAACA